MSQTAEFNFGARIRLKATFTVDSVLTSPSSAPTIAIKKPDGTLESSPPVPTESSAGIWVATYTPSNAGTYWVRWVAGASVHAVDEGWFVVKESKVV